MRLKLLFISCPNAIFTALIFTLASIKTSLTFETHLLIDIFNSSFKYNSNWDFCRNYVIWFAAFSSRQLLFEVVPFAINFNIKYYKLLSNYSGITTPPATRGQQNGIFIDDPKRFELHFNIQPFVHISGAHFILQFSVYSMHNKNIGYTTAALVNGIR